MVGPFEEVTTDLGRVILRLNERFGTSFRPFEHTAAHQQEVFDELEGYWSGQVDSPAELERFVGRPSEMREAWKAGLRARYGGDGLGGLRHEARRLFERFVNPESR